MVCCGLFPALTNDAMGTTPSATHTPGDNGSLSVENNTNFMIAFKYQHGLYSQKLNSTPSRSLHQ
jgi:hypothetical protein